MCGRTICEYGGVVVPLGSVHTLDRHQVGIGTLPAARHCRTVKVYEQMMLCRAFEQVDVVIHRFLAVAREEVDFDSGKAVILKPCKLFLAVFGLVEPEFRAGGSVDPSCA